MVNAKPGATRTPRRLSREESRALTRDRLLDAAQAAFASRGFYGATLEEISESAGYSRGAVYSNFADKDELFLAVMDRRSHQEIDEIADLLQRDPRPDAFFEALRDRDRRRHPEAERWFMLSTEFFLYAMRNPKVRPQLARFEQTIRAAMSRAVVAVYESVGVPPPMPLEQTGLIVQALDQGLAIQRFIDPNSAPSDFLFDVLAWLLRASVALEQASPGTGPAPS
jgi:AcrR family transcriptional regulator